MDPGLRVTYPERRQTQSQTNLSVANMSTTAAEASIISYPHHQTLDHHRQSRTELRSVNVVAEMAACYPSYELPPQQQHQKDYSRPLHVDCSVEYELPNTAKPPQGVRNEPLLMIHPCYFRKIESQRRSPFVNNLPPATRQRKAAVAALKQQQHQPQHQQQQPHQGAQYPHHQLWEPMPPPQGYCKMTGGDAVPDRSPDRPEHNNILSGKYRQYLRAHRLHPYVTSAAIPIASTFPQIHQQVCYNVWSLWCDTEQPLVIIVCSEEVRVRCAPGVVVIRQLCSLIRIPIDLCFFCRHHINLFFLGVVVVIRNTLSYYYSWVSNHHRQMVILDFVVPSDKSNFRYHLRINNRYRQAIIFFYFVVPLDEFCLDVCDGRGFFVWILNYIKYWKKYGLRRWRQRIPPPRSPSFKFSNQYSSSFLLTGRKNLQVHGISTFKSKLFAGVYNSYRKIGFPVIFCDL